MKHTFALLTAAVLGLGLSACGTSGTAASSSAPTSPAPAISAAPASSAASSTTSGTTSSAPAEPTTEAPQTAGSLTEQDGKLVDTDLTATVVEGAGFNISIDPAAMIATFGFVDPTSGEPFQNYAEFNYTDGTFLRHVVSSAMGKTYNYTADLASNELVSVFDDAGNDLSQSTKDAGRWDKAATETLTLKDGLEAYFAERYGKSIEDATAGK